MAQAKRFVLLATVVGLPLVFFGDHPDEPFNITKLAFLMAGVSCATALHLLQWAYGSRSTGIRTILLPALALVVPLAVSWLASPYRTWALFGQFSRFNGLIPYALFALLGILLVDSFRDRAGTLARALGTTGGLVGAYAFIQSLGLDPLWQPGTDGGSPFPPSSIGHYNFAGGFLAICLPFAIYLWVTSTRSWPPMAMIVLITLGLVMTNSQGAWVAAVAGVVIVSGGLAAPRWHRAKAVSLGLVGGLVIALVAGVVISAGSDSPPLGGTAKSRGLLWGTALEMGANSPLVGRGPAAYAVEGVRYRPLEYMLLETNTVADDPHNIPLAFWANGGALGVLGFLLFAGWIVKRGSHLGTDNPLGTAFFAGSIAYLVQSLVTIDELALRSGLWVSIAGLAISSHRMTDSESRLVGRGVRMGAITVAVSIALAGVWYSVGLLRAHHQVVSARDRFEEGDVATGDELFTRATGFRFEPRYLNAYATNLAGAALTAGEDGASLIERMTAVNGYLDDFPSTTALLDQARVFLYWGHFEPSALDLAEATLLETEPLDPENPQVEIRLAEVFLARGDALGAIELLAPLANGLADREPGFSATLATARAVSGDPVTGRTDLERAIASDPTDCRVLTALAIYERLETGRISDQLTSNIGINCGTGISVFREGLIKVFDL